jgi:diamine N-acetyltransferase
MQNSTRIRRAQDDDAVALATLAASTFRDAFAESNSAADMQLHCETAYGQSIQLAEIRDVGRETWLAEVEGTLLAYVQLRLNACSDLIRDPRAVEIQRFYVDASRHGSGLAHELMTLMLKRAAVAGAATIWLGVWERNPKAIAFYRKWGFDVVGEHLFKLGHDPQRDLILQRALEAAPRAPG